MSNGLSGVQQLWFSPKGDYSVVRTVIPNTGSSRPASSRKKTRGDKPAAENPSPPLALTQFPRSQLSTLPPTPAKPLRGLSRSGKACAAFPCLCPCPRGTPFPCAPPVIRTDPCPASPKQGIPGIYTLAAELGHPGGRGRAFCRLGEEFLFPRLMPTPVLPIPCLKAPQKHPQQCGAGFLPPRTHLIPPHGGFSNPSAALCALIQEKEKKKIKKIQSPSQALCRDYWQFGDRSSNSGRENRLAPALTGVSLEKPGPRVFLRSVMSHPDPAGSSSCPWKTRLDAGRPAPRIRRRGLAGSWVGTHSQPHPRSMPGC